MVSFVCHSLIISPLIGEICVTVSFHDQVPQAADSGRQITDAYGVSWRGGCVSRSLAGHARKILEKNLVPGTRHRVPLRAVRAVNVAAQGLNLQQNSSPRIFA